ncbi:MAG TPA: hypothetical protein VM912_05640 [Terriglobales bacterium]|nr:hypothetical protein [Terriglobales bacterium]
MIEDAGKQLALKLNHVPQSGNPEDVAMPIADRDTCAANERSRTGRQDSDFGGLSDAKVMGK